GGEACVVEGARDGGGAERRGGDAGELAQQGADGGALGTDDDDVGHGIWVPLGVRPAKWCRVDPDSRARCCSAANSACGPHKGERAGTRVESGLAAHMTQIATRPDSTHAPTRRRHLLFALSVWGCVTPQAECGAPTP